VLLLCVHLPAAVQCQITAELRVTFLAQKYQQADFIQQHLLSGLLDFVLSLLPAAVQLHLQLQYYQTMRADEQPKPFFSAQAQGRRAPALALPAPACTTT
jgi:hypothetical protein